MGLSSVAVLAAQAESQAQASIERAKVLLKERAQCIRQE
jgi:hypothetical protein